MNNTYSLDQIQNTGGPDADLMRQYKLDKMVNIMEINSNNPELKQPKIARLSSNYHLLQYTDIKENIFCFHLLRIPPSTNTNQTRKQKTTNTNLDDVKVTSNDHKKTSKDLKTTSNELVENKKNKTGRWCKYWN